MEVQSLLNPFPYAAEMLLIANTLCVVVLLAEFLIPQEFRFHSPSRNMFDALLLFDAIRMGFLCVVVCTRVL